MDKHEENKSPMLNKNIDQSAKDAATQNPATHEMTADEIQKELDRLSELNKDRDILIIPRAAQQTIAMGMVTIHPVATPDGGYQVSIHNAQSKRSLHVRSWIEWKTLVELIIKTNGFERFASKDGYTVTRYAQKLWIEYPGGIQPYTLSDTHVDHFVQAVMELKSRMTGVLEIPKGSNL